MKLTSETKNWLSKGVAGLCLAVATCSSLAQTAQNPQGFDTGKGSWIIWNGWGMQGFPLDWDYSMDSASDGNSGSLRYQVPFTGASGEQFMTFGTLANRWGWDGGVIVNCVGAYTNVSLNLIVDPSTAPTINNDYGPLEVGLTTDGWGTIGLGTYTVPLSATNWTHIVWPIDPTLANLEKVNGFYIKMWSNGTFTNTFTFNVDNIWLEPVPTNAPPTPPPTVSLVKAVNGLNLAAAGAGQYDRQNIRTVSPEYNWVGKGSTPVSYSFTVAGYPGADHPNFEIHTYLIPLPFDPAVGTGTIDTGSAPDWNQTNCIFMELQNRADGSAVFTFRWKTNSIPDGNGTYYSAALGILTDTNGPLGTWTLSFLNDTQVTMTSPSGIITNFEFSADKLAGYKDNTGTALPLYFYIGAKPQDSGNIGLSAQVSHVKIQGAGTPIDQNFLTQSALDSNIWELAANNGTAGVQVVPQNSVWVNWTLPDAGFALQTNSVVIGGGWKENTNATLLLGNHRAVLLSASDKPGTSQGFFRLLKRQFSKLQVLMPGETNAPGTVTGKIGTPDAQFFGVPFNVTVNAVDDTWHVITLAANDMVTITSSDDTAVLPADAALVSGTKTFSVMFGATGTFTVTASDTTDAKKTANTGSSTTCN
ncbi:MAG TPA: hypothetical protein VFE51_10535 [Verrucomicrobiae bacterium]|nr:hypothetical protein [Verrucomicrobiae bacterium]